MPLFGREPNVNWVDTSSVKAYLDERNEGYSFLNGREEVIKYRLGNERTAREKIYLFGGDFIAEDFPNLGYPTLSLRELELLIRAVDRDVDVKVLVKWDPSSAKLVGRIKDYVEAKIPIRKWSGDIRGGVFDDEIYAITRHISTPPSELTADVAEHLPRKTVADPQSDEAVPLELIRTKNQDLVEILVRLFKREYDEATPMKEMLDELEQSISERRNNGHREE